MAGVFVAVVWAFAEPWAAEFIAEQVDVKLEGVVEQGEAVDEALRNQVNQLELLVDEQRISQGAQRAEFDTIKSLAAESRADIKKILFNLRGLRRELE